MFEQKQTNKKMRKRENKIENLKDDLDKMSDALYNILFDNKSMYFKHDNHQTTLVIIDGAFLNKETIFNLEKKMNRVHAYQIKKC